MSDALADWNVLDAAVVLLWAIALYLGYHKGFIRQVLQATALVGGIALAARFHGPIAQHAALRPLAERFGEGAVEILAFAGVFLTVFAAGHLLAAGFRAAATGRAIGGLDRLFGGLLGLAKASLFAGLLLLALCRAAPEDGLARLVRGSYLGSRLVRGARQVVRAIPEEAKAPIREFLQGDRARGRRDGDRDDPAAAPPERGLRRPSPPRFPWDTAAGDPGTALPTPRVDPPRPAAPDGPGMPRVEPPIEPDRGGTPPPAARHRSRDRWRPPIRIAPSAPGASTPQVGVF